MAHAQDAPQQDNGGYSENTDGFGTIVVTARRREENIQDAPLAITALSSDALENMNVQSSTDLDARIPNLSLSPSPGNASSTLVAYIRGIGEYAPNFTNDATVGVYVDGVYHARMSGNLSDLIDIERLEVLRGPQGTLFGRNTTGGALNILTRKPQNQAGANLRLGYGSDDEITASGSFDTGDLGTSGIKARLGIYHHQRDGFVDNTLTKSSDDPGAVRTTAINGAVTAELGGLTLDYRGDYSRTRAISNASQVFIASQAVQDYFSKSPDYGGAPFVVSNRYLSKLAQAGTLPASRITSYGNALTAEYSVNDSVSIKSITAWRNLSIRENTQLDGNGPLLGEVLGVTGPVMVSPYAALPSSRRKQNQFSQELQILGKAGDLDYVAGLFYFNEHVSEFAPYFLTFVIDADTALNIQPTTAYGAGAKSYAAFGQVSWRPSSLDGRMELTLGGRYTHDKRTMDQQNSSDGVLLPARSLERSFKNFSWTASLSYKWTPDVMTFARFATGYKAGGFNPQSVNDGYGPMKATSGEVGIKADLADRKVRINATAFYTDYNDLQVTQFVAGSNGTTNETVNAGRAVYKGVELEVAVIPLPGFRLEGSLGYVDPKYKKFLYRDPVLDEILDVADEARFAYVSKTTAHLAAQYQADVGVGELTLRVDYSYKSGRYWNVLDRDSPYNAAIRGGADNNLGARIALGKIPFAGGELEVAAWGDNLLNKHVIVGGIDYGSLGFGGVTYNRPRNGGVEVRASF
ncbi:hypothetical protein MB02_12525 [Croceicoccus estronivorus]|nr:hypothetical protein MB02_12525 [Croceicoccus estronivorus]